MISDIFKYSKQIRNFKNECLKEYYMIKIINELNEMINAGSFEMVYSEFKSTKNLDQYNKSLNQYEIDIPIIYNLLIHSFLIHNSYFCFNTTLHDKCSRCFFIDKKNNIQSLKSTYKLFYSCVIEFGDIDFIEKQFEDYFIKINKIINDKMFNMAKFLIENYYFNNKIVVNCNNLNHYNGTSQLLTCNGEFSVFSFNKQHVNFLNDDMTIKNLAMNLRDDYFEKAFDI